MLQTGPRERPPLRAAFVLAGPNITGDRQNGRRLMTRHRAKIHLLRHLRGMREPILRRPRGTKEPILRLRGMQVPTNSHHDPMVPTRDRTGPGYTVAKSANRSPVLPDNSAPGYNGSSHTRRGSRTSPNPD
jgi:hypothetical protein